MIKSKVTINAEIGLHARPATVVFRTACKYKSDIKIIKDDIRADAKSIIAILSLGAAYGDKVDVITEGEDEVVAHEAVVKALENTY